MTTNIAVNLTPSRQPGLVLANPVMLASGTCGYGGELAEISDIQRLGALVCKGTTLEAREGNPQPRIAETPAGMLNSIGLQNIGVEALVRDLAPVWADWRLPVVVNIAGATIEEYAAVAARLEGVVGISAIELNIGCPNVKAGGAEFGANPEAAAAVTAAVRRATTLPLIVKLTPNTADIVAVAGAVAEAGAEAVTLINTLRGMAIDIKRRRPVLGNIYGGLSGPAVKPVALGMVYQVVAAVAVPVIGCGGIVTASDALEFIMAGASAVEIGTAALVDPQAPLEILEGITGFMAREGIRDINELVGAAQPPAV
jgi:dihydroorotate dehydrogenase (NAD+) catalytic subunit